MLVLEGKVGEGGAIVVDAHDSEFEVNAADAAPLPA